MQLLVLGKDTLIIRFFRGDQMEVDPGQLMRRGGPPAGEPSAFTGPPGRLASGIIGLR